MNRVGTQAGPARRYGMAPSLPTCLRVPGGWSHLWAKALPMRFFSPVCLSTSHTVAASWPRQCAHSPVCPSTCLRVPPNWPRQRAHRPTSPSSCITPLFKRYYPSRVRRGRRKALPFEDSSIFVEHHVINVYQSSIIDRHCSMK